MPSHSETTTGELLSQYLGEQLERLERERPRALAGQREGVHQVRVAARRMRSVLATYRSVLPPTATDLREDLGRLGRSLGPARDAEVLEARLDDLVDGQPPEVVAGAARRRLEDELAARREQGRADTVSALEDERLTRLVERMTALRAAAGSWPGTERPARTQVPDLLQADLDRLRKRLRATTRSHDPGETDRAWHEVRKAAKRLRYAAESAGPVLGSRAAELARAAEGLQEALGEHQDSVNARCVLNEVAAQARRAGEGDDSYAHLVALEEERARRIEQGVPDLVERLPSRRLRHWLAE